MILNVLVDFEAIRSKKKLSVQKSGRGGGLCKLVSRKLPKEISRSTPLFETKDMTIGQYLMLRYTVLNSC